MTRRGAVLALASVVLAGSVYAEDVLVIRDRTRRKGVVASCREDACTLDGVAVARGLIAWVGLRQGDAATPAARDPLKDEVHLVDGRVVTGEFGGLSLGAVAIEDSSFDRDEVNWIRFAGPEPAASPRPSPGGPNYRFSPSPPAGSPGPAPSASPRGPSPPPTPSPSTRPPSSSPPPPRGSPSSGACGPVPSGFVEEDGGRWTGTMKGRTHTGHGHLVNTQVDVRLHECRYRWKGQKMVGLVEYSKLVDEGSIVTRNYSTLRSHAGTCTYSGAGTRRATGERGEIMRTVQAVAPGGNATWSEYTYVVGMAPDQEVPYTENCGDGSRTYARDGQGGGWSLNSGDGRQLPLTGGRMAGRYNDELADFTSWSICREGTQCPPPPEPGPTTSSSPSPDACGSLDQARAQVDVLWDQRQSRAPALEAAWQELKASHDAMLGKLQAWQDAVGICAIAEFAQLVLTEAAGEFGEALDLAAQIAEGDLSYLNPSEGAGAALDILGGLARAAGAGDPASMRDHLAGCAALPEGLRRRANAFVDDYADVLRLMPLVQQHINYFRTQDQKYWDQWNTYYRDCLRYAQCKGLPASTCPEPPPTPSGPMPRE